MGGWRWFGLLALLSSLWLAACGSGSSGFDASPVDPTDGNVPPGERVAYPRTFHALLPCEENAGQSCALVVIPSRIPQVALDPEVTEGGVCEPEAEVCHFPVGVFLHNVPASATVRLATRLPEAAAAWQLHPVPLQMADSPLIHLEDTLALKLPHLFSGEVLKIDIAVLVWLAPIPEVPLSFASLMESRADFLWHGLLLMQAGFE